MAKNYIDGCLFGIVQRDSEKKLKLKINDFTIPLYSTFNNTFTISQNTIVFFPWNGKR